MDEATANVDIKTERIIEEMKEKHFNKVTQIIVAHRLNTLDKADKILS